MGFDREFSCTDEELPEVNVEVTSKSTALGGKRYTFSLGRTFVNDKDGLSRTGWLQLKHISALRRLLDRVEKELGDLEKSAAEEKKAFLNRIQEKKS
jgi:hypothetical protein